MSFIPTSRDCDFAGELVIKVQLGDDLRRILIHNEELTYDELILMMQRVFKPKLDALNNFVIKYKDEDNEYVTIAEEFDLSYAIHRHKTLRLKLFVPQLADSTAEDIAGDVTSSKSEFDAKDLLAEVKRLHVDLNVLSEKFDQLVQKFNRESRSSPHCAVGSQGPEKTPKAHHDSGAPATFPEESSNVGSTSSKLDDSSLPPFAHNLNKQHLSPPPEQPPVTSSFSSQPMGLAPFESASTSLASGEIGQTPLMMPPSSTSTVGPPLMPPTSSLSGCVPPVPLPPTQPLPQQQQPALLPTTNLPPPQLATSQTVFQPPGPRPAFMSGPPMPPPQQQQQQQRSISPPPLQQSRPISTTSNVPLQVGGHFQPPMPPPVPMMSGLSSCGSVIPPPPPMPMMGGRFPTSMAPMPPQSSMPPPQLGMPSSQPGMQRMPLQLGGPPTGPPAPPFGAPMPPPPTFSAYDQRHPQ